MAKSTGTMIAATGTTVIGLINQVREMNAAARLNEQVNQLDADQISKSLQDRARIRERKLWKDVGSVRAGAAKSGVLLEGSPLMAMEETYQNGLDDLDAMREQASLKIGALAEETYQGYISARKGARAAAIKTAESILGSAAKAG